MNYGCGYLKKSRITVFGLYGWNITVLQKNRGIESRKTQKTLKV